MPNSNSQNNQDNSAQENCDKAHSAKANSAKTHFGFKAVDENQKQSLVGQVFSSVAAKYDLMNDLMSAGLHRVWKNKMMEEIKFIPNQIYQTIDVAGGTGDIAFRILKKAQEKIAQEKTAQEKFSQEKISPIKIVPIRIEVADINPEMLRVGKQRAVDKNLFKNLNFNCCDGENLPYCEGQFDFYTIAFGIRNFTNIQAGLNEAFRVLKAGGKFICLEFSQVNNLALAKIYDFYSFKAIPKIGGLVANDQASYQYLVESIRQFPDQENFKLMIQKAGFKNVSYQSLNFGVVAIHTGYKY